ncbi:MAG: hypothetical protein MI861_20450 [Pirellulales bacterium]|nr:hypothetical protein [Pirellulales bacterium]
MTASEPISLPRYRIDRTYRWNYDHSPEPVKVDVTELAGSFSFAGLPTRGPLGVSAGPLLNGRWILYYASLGFDVLTYKTVRSRARQCYELPNLVHVPDQRRLGGDSDVVASGHSTGSWAVSFGMPSAPPDHWRADIESTRRQLAGDQLLNVSVVGTVQPHWTVEDLAADYAQCARWAVEAGADTVEANLSCPNVDTCDGQLYQQPPQAGMVAEAIRQAIGSVPLILKIGHVMDESAGQRLLDAVATSTSAIAMTNSIPSRVAASVGGNWHFAGATRGICGLATYDASLRQVAMFARLIESSRYKLKIIGVGGAGNAQQVREYREAGAECVHLATAAMLRPDVALKIKHDLASQSESPASRSRRRLRSVNGEPFQ